MGMEKQMKLSKKKKTKSEKAQDAILKLQSKPISKPGEKIKELKKKSKGKKSRSQLMFWIWLRIMIMLKKPN